MKRNNDVINSIYFQIAEKHGVSKETVRNVVLSVFKKVAIQIRYLDIYDIQTFSEMRIVYFGTFSVLTSKIRKYVQARQKQQDNSGS